MEYSEQISKMTKCNDSLNSRGPDKLIPKLKQQGTQDGETTTPLLGDQFRLVTLRHGSFSENVQCYIEKRALADKPPYYALSYCWGDEKIQKPIFVNSQKLQIRSNLYDALVSLRKPNEDLTIWIDLLCINQSDDEEKQRQVDLMHRIYGQAEFIIAWLGEHQADSERLFDIGNLMDFDYQPGAAFKAFLSRDYWYRAWIVQELLAKPDRVRLRCGLDEKPFSHFSSMCLSIQTFARVKIDPVGMDKKITFSDPYEIPERISTFLSSNALGQDGGLSLSKFLDTFLDSRCRDPRDNIFAFKHLFAPFLQETIQIDYSQPPEKVIPRVFMAMIEKTQSLHILLIRSQQKLPKGRDNWQKQLPTWCPFVGVPYKVPLFSGCDTRKEVPNMPILGIGRDHLLHAKGVVLGRVFQVQRSSSLGGVKNVGNDEDLRKAEHKLHEYVEFIAWRSFKQRNRKKISLGISKRPENLSDYLREVKYRVDKYYQFIAWGPPKKNNRLKAAAKKAIQRTCLHKNLASMGPGCVIADSRFDPESISQLRYFARVTFARAICSFKWKKFLHNHDANMLQNGVTLDYALSPSTGRRGDVICALWGCETPVLLRSTGKHYQVLGEVSICDTDSSEVLSQCDVFDDFILC